MQTKVLKSLLKQFDHYLHNMGANEIAISAEKELFLDIDGTWQQVHDEHLTYSLLDSFCVELANSRETLFDAKHPTLSTSIPGTNYRVQAMHTSVLANQRLQINIRIPSKRIFSTDDFTLGNNVNHSFEEIISWVKERKNILISGGTASGKTSFLNTLLQEISPDERVVIIEDSPEISIKNINKTQILVSKNDDANFTYVDGINSAMRLSPTRLILGELDTRNTLAFLRLNNTGHSGSVSTLHANSPVDAINALTANAMFHHSITKSVLQDYIRSALDYIIQLNYSRSERARVITSILDVKKMNND